VHFDWYDNSKSIIIDFSYIYYEIEEILFIGSVYTNCVYYFAIKEYISNVYVYSVKLCYAFAF